jgi:hypothetical protein
MSAKRTRPRRGKPGDRDALKKELWAAVRAASALLDSENPDVRLRAVHATAQAGNVYRGVLGENELEALVTELEKRADRNKL